MPGTAPVPITRISQIDQPTQLSHICREPRSVPYQAPGFLVQALWVPRIQKSHICGVFCEVPDTLVERSQSFSQLCRGGLAQWSWSSVGVHDLNTPIKGQGRAKDALGLWRANWQQQQGDLPHTSPVALGNKRILVLYCVLYVLHLFNKPDIITEIGPSLPGLHTGRRL